MRIQTGGDDLHADDETAQLRTATLHAVPVDVLTEVEIERPREHVASFAADPDNATSR